MNTLTEFIGMHIMECSAEFETATYTKLEELFVNAEEELPQFFKIKGDIFSLGQDGTVALNQSNNIPMPPKQFKK